MCLNLRTPLFLLLLLSVLFSGCKQNAPIKDPKVTEKTEEEKFPTAWLGKWKGQLTIHKPNGDTTQVAMQLHVLENDSIDGWDLKLIYGEDLEKGTRNYTLYERNPSKGHYVIDENNSIVLDAFLLGNSLFSRFSVGESLLLAQYQKQGDQLHFTIISGKEKSLTMTGGEEDVPKIGSFGISVYQNAVLSR